MTNKKPVRPNAPATTLGERLFAALTEAEIAQILEMQFKILSSEQHQALLAELPTDTRRTVQQLFAVMTPASPAAENATFSVSVAKRAETWSKLWDEWNRIVAEAADEEGEYYVRDEEWEPPYLDESAIIEDLEQVATKMRPLVETAFANNFSNAVSFADALLAAEEDISTGMPEWIGTMEGLNLGQNLTWCLLQWEWLTAQTQDQDAYAFAETLRSLEDELTHTNWDGETLIDFFIERTAEEQQQVFQGMDANKETSLWKKPLTSVHSPWNVIYMDYVERFAPERRLEMVRLTIPQQWENGLPVIEELLKTQAYRESLAVVSETLASMLSRIRSETPWTPESALLFPLIAQYHGDKDHLVNYKKLLQYYQQTVRGLGQSDLVNILELQLIGIDYFYQWPKMLDAFSNAPIPTKTRQALLQSWQQAIVRRTEPQGWGGMQKLSDSWWLPWLLTSIDDKTKGVAWFQMQITQWLTMLPGDRKSMETNGGRLRLLTNDLITLRGIAQNPYPRFHAVVIRPQEFSRPDAQSRQAYLQQYAPADLWERVIDYWRKNLQNLVPSPAQTGNSDYSNQAQWMAALKELAPQNYETMLKQWRIDHQRRRNLWKAMDLLGLK